MHLALVMENDEFQQRWENWEKKYRNSASTWRECRAHAFIIKDSQQTWVKFISNIHACFIVCGTKWDNLKNEYTKETILDSSKNLWKVEKCRKFSIRHHSRIIFHIILHSNINNEWQLYNYKEDIKIWRSLTLLCGNSKYKSRHSKS